MASNVREWTTEYSSSSNIHSTYRGGNYNNSTYYTSYRNDYISPTNGSSIGFRPIIYVNI